MGEAEIEIEALAGTPDALDDILGGAEVEAAAVKMQAAMRSKAARNRVRTIRGQKQERRRQKELALRHRDEAEEAAAIRIQASARARASKRRVLQIRMHRHEAELQQQQHRAAGCLQAVARGRRDRNRVAALRSRRAEAADAAARAAAQAAADAAELRRVEEEASAVRLQSAVRSRAARQRVEFMRAQREVESAARTAAASAQMAQEAAAKAELADDAVAAAEASEALAAAPLPLLKEDENEIDEDEDYHGDADFGEFEMTSSAATGADASWAATANDSTSLGAAMQPVFTLGERVECKCEGWAHHYPGVVTAVPTPAAPPLFYTVEFDDGETRNDVDQRVMRKGMPVADMVAAETAALATTTNTAAAAESPIDSSARAHAEEDAAYDDEFADFENELAALGLDKPASVNASPVILFQKGDRVQARADGWQKSYPGQVQEVQLRSDGSASYRILFDDGEDRVIEHNNVTPIGGFPVAAEPVAKHAEPTAVGAAGTGGSLDMPAQTSTARGTVAASAAATAAAATAAAALNPEDELKAAEAQLAADLAELNALMSGHTDILNGQNASEATAAELAATATTSGTSTAALVAEAEAEVNADERASAAAPSHSPTKGTVVGSMMGGDLLFNDDDEDSVSGSSSEDPSVEFSDDEFEF